MPKNFNPINIFLIPKVNNLDRVEDYMPIVVSNFLFKIITMVLADRLGPIASHIVSPQQSVFIKGRSIVDGIIITSECLNVLGFKSYGGNMACKFDIVKAFDTLEWPFLIKALRLFGFHEKFIHWIEVILGSSRLSFKVNGGVHGYIECERG